MEILVDWPSPPSGGCKYLLQCREWFLVQMGVLAQAKIRWSDDRVIRVPGEGDKEYSRFGLSLDEVGD